MSDTRRLQRSEESKENQPDNQHLLVAFVGDSQPGAQAFAKGDGRAENIQPQPDPLVSSVQHLREAHKHVASSEQAEKEGRLGDAKKDLSKAIAEADQADMRPWRDLLKQIDERQKMLPGKPESFVESRQLMQEKKELQGVLNLAVDLRLQAATLCLIERDPLEARRYLQQTLKLDPEIVKSFGYKRINDFIIEFSKGYMETVTDWIKKQGKELLVDGASGGAGLFVSALFPQRMLMRRLAFGLLASGVTRYGLRTVSGEETNFGSDMMWGSVDYLSFRAGARVHQRMADRLALTAESGAMRYGFLGSPALNSWQANAAGIGTASLIYRGSHNIADIGKIDERTGWTYNGRDAAFDTVLGAGSDSLFGATALSLGRTALPFAGRLGNSNMRVAGRELPLAPLGQAFSLSAFFPRLALRSLGSAEPEQAFRSYLMPGKKLGEMYERPQDRYQYDLDHLLHQLQKPAGRDR